MEKLATTSLVGNMQILQIIKIPERMINNI